MSEPGLPRLEEDSAFFNAKTPSFTKLQSKLKSLIILRYQLHAIERQTSPSHIHSVFSINAAPFSHYQTTAHLDIQHQSRTRHNYSIQSHFNINIFQSMGHNINRHRTRTADDFLRLRTCVLDVADADTINGISTSNVLACEPTARATWLVQR
ncbi:hypothetical protein AC579_1107 [Pseudocercospora musae]|uniref:Uncharacterized protein n=1 Tax=Pseudocercospora musae TaxID=113226 RepID=A0A139HZT3_9PEZI|nr:hypothetical protein AC579_1107 [Pseudocercospora musae]